MRRFGRGGTVVQERFLPGQWGVWAQGSVLVGKKTKGSSWRVSVIVASDVTPGSLRLQVELVNNGDKSR